MSKFLRFARLAIIGLLSLELTYVGASALFLNTSLFARALGMMDTTDTHVRVTGGWSPYPGKVIARGLLIAIRDPNVEIDVRLRSLAVPFEPADLFRRRLTVGGLRVGSVQASVRSRTPRERARWMREHPDPRAGRPPPDWVIEERRRTRWAIRVPALTLERVDPIELGDQKFTSEMRIDGGFELHTGVEAEVFPTTVRFANGVWPAGLSNLSGEVTARFHRFNVAKTSGSEVFRYLDASARFSGRTENFDYLNLTLRSLNGFGITRGRTDFLAEVIVRAGELQPGSRFETPPDGELLLQGPTVSVRGPGFIRWWVPEREDASRLLFSMKRTEGTATLSSLKLDASALRLKAEARISGLDLRRPFTGLTGNLEIRGGRYTVESRPSPNEPPTAVRWKASGRVDGALAGAAAESDPSARRLADTEGVKITVERGSLRVPLKTARGTPTSLQVRGDLRIGGRRLILTREAVFPPAVLDLRFADARLKERNRSIRVRFASNGARYVRGETGQRTWTGLARMRILGVNEGLDRLRDSGALSAPLRIAAEANQVDAHVAWDLRPGYVRLRADRIESDGSWSGEGAIASEAGGHWVGLMSVKLLGLPVGISVGPKGIEWKIDPGLVARGGAAQAASIVPVKSGPPAAAPSPTARP